jgi:hypothetical protein
MKILALTLSILFIFGMTTSSSAQTAEMLTIKAGQQKVAKTSRLKIKFISVTEDSRCPVGVDCVWAGNAKVKVQIIGSRSTKEFEFNTTMGPKGDMLDGWAIYLEDLTPVPQANKKLNAKLYTAKFKVTRLGR